MPRLTKKQVQDCIDTTTIEDARKWAKLGDDDQFFFVMRHLGICFDTWPEYSHEFITGTIKKVEDHLRSLIKQKENA
jgi:hypothetical protein